MNAEFDLELRQDFLVEAGELLDRLGEQLVALEATPRDSELLNAVFRAFHTVKGGAGFLALEPMVLLCHHAEDLLNEA
ncbi:MAG: Hpt domain-containing protein, partial [Rhodanobacter sp.]